MSSSVQAIRFESVSKSFDGRHVLDDVSFDVARGAACCIMGRSGTGKSVTLKLLMGLLKPESGRILVNDRELVALNSRELVAIRPCSILFRWLKTWRFHFAVTRE